VATVGKGWTKEVFEAQLCTAPAAGFFCFHMHEIHMEVSSVMKIHPLADRVLVKPLDEKETKKGGIIVPDTAKEKPSRGTVVAVGDGRIDDGGKRIPPEVKKGDTVLFGKYSGSEIDIDNEKYLILREGDILAKI
jgi:chaperonin GroES